MPTKRHSSEQIISKLREAEVHLAQGMTIPLMCKKLGIHQQTYYKWRREYGGLRMDQAKRRRFWFNDGSCIRLRPRHRDHVWRYDFVHCRTHDGRAFRMLTMLDEFTRECLTIDVERRLNNESVLERLSDLFVCRGVPDHIRCDNGPEFTAERVRDWLRSVEVKTLFIEPGSPWENGYIESFNGKLRDELLKGEIFDTLWEAKVLIERWRRVYNSIRPHSSLGYRAPVPKAKLFCSPASAPLQQASRTAIDTIEHGVL